MATLLPCFDMRLSKITRTKKKTKKKKNKKRKSEKLDYLHVHVSSYQEFKSLVEQYVNKGGVSAVSFDISDDVDAKSYSCMLDDILTNNSKLGRFDKVKNPRSDHRPFPIVRCYTVKEMDNVYKAIGNLWRVVMAERSRYNFSKSNKHMEKLYAFRKLNMIFEHNADPYWA